jgi:subtilisin-like proprotein convertase family protein
MDFPSDEDANGTWTLRIENLNPELSGTVVDFGLEITSRWD